MHKAVVVAAGLVCAASQAQADLAPLGRADMQIFGFRVYAAELRTQAGEAFDWSRPFELAITYDTDISARRLTAITADEMVRTGGDAPPDLVTKLGACFADVDDGDRFVARPLGPDRVALRLNDGPDCTVEHPNATRRFFDIWLSDEARDPAASRRLRGLR